jgi:hypothetical protein
MAGLKIARGFELSVDEAVTQTFAILAQRRKGKTYTANVIAEEMVAAGIPWVAIDPTGAWWGLRAGKDGKRSGGLPVYVFGGDHGDLPLNREAGSQIADLVVEQPRWYVLDLSHFESKEAERQFATSFAERFYRRKGKSKSRMHLFIDEADIFVPQRSPRGDQRMLGAFEQIVRRGGIRGIGTTLISQRAAVVNKNVLEMIDVLIVLRVVGPNDRKAVREYVDARGYTDQVKEMIESLAALDIGEAWFWEPGGDIFKRVKVRERRTFNSSATPGAGRQQAVVLADIDLEALRGKLDAAIEKAKAEDPKELQRQLFDARRELEKAKQMVPRDVAPKVERVEVRVPVVTDAERKQLGKIGETLGQIHHDLDDLKKLVGQRLAEATEMVETQRQRQVARERVRISRTSARVPDLPSSDGQVELGKGEKAVLGVLRQWPEGKTYKEVAFLSGYSARASTMRVILGKLRSIGYVEPGLPVRLTPEGLAAAGGAEARPTGPALLDHWRNHPKMGRGEREVLDVLVEAWPDELTHEELCERAGYSPDASTMRVILGHLRSLGLVEKRARRLVPEFADAIGR